MAKLGSESVLASCSADRDAGAGLFDRQRIFYHRLNYVDQFAANSDGCEPEWRATLL